MAQLNETVGDDVPTLAEVQEKIEARYAKAKAHVRAQPRRRSSRGCSRSSRPPPTSRPRAACSELRAELGLGRRAAGAGRAPAARRPPPQPRPQPGAGRRVPSTDPPTTPSSPARAAPPHGLSRRPSRPHRRGRQFRSVAGSVRSATRRARRPMRRPARRRPEPPLLAGARTGDVAEPRPSARSSRRHSWYADHVARRRLSTIGAGVATTLDRPSPAASRSTGPRRSRAPIARADVRTVLESPTADRARADDADAPARARDRERRPATARAHCHDRRGRATRLRYSQSGSDRSVDAGVTVHSVHLASLEHGRTSVRPRTSSHVDCTARRRPSARAWSSEPTPRPRDCDSHRRRARRSTASPAVGDDRRPAPDAGGARSCAERRRRCRPSTAVRVTCASAHRGRLRHMHPRDSPSRSAGRRHARVDRRGTARHAGRRASARRSDVG